MTIVNIAKCPTTVKFHDLEAGCYFYDIDGDLCGKLAISVMRDGNSVNYVHMESLQTFHKNDYDKVTKVNTVEIKVNS